MSDRIFVDRNIFIYAYSETEPQKRRIALKILNSKGLVISTQVVNEFIWVMQRKFGVPRPKLQIIGNKLLNRFDVTLVNLTTIESALSIFVSYKYSYWDSLIIASALESNCSILYTEDMQNGQIIEDKLKIVNPFVTNR